MIKEKRNHLQCTFNVGRRLHVLNAHLFPEKFEIVNHTSTNLDASSMNQTNYHENNTTQKLLKSNQKSQTITSNNTKDTTYINDISEANNLKNIKSIKDSMERNSLKSFNRINSDTNTTFQNWAQIHACQPERIFYPSTEEEVCQIILEAKARNKQVKVFGSGHSPSGIAICDSPSDWMIHLKNLSGIIKLKGNLVYVRGGTTLNEINAQLEKNGKSLSSLGSISEQSISGAISTGTHGTGLQFGNLSSIVERLRVVDANGKVHVAKRGEDLWYAAVCSIGALGIITEVVLRVEPLFKLYAIQKPMPLDHVLENLDHLTQCAEHYRFWWFPHTNHCISWSANRVDTQTKSTSEIKTYIEQFYDQAKDKLVGYHLFEFSYYISSFFPSLVPTINRFYYYSLFSDATSNVDTSYKVFNFDCRFKQYVNEWAIPIEKTRDAIISLKKLIKERNFKVHLPIEVRFVKKDNIWMSPSYQRDVCYIGIIMYRPYGKNVPFEEYFDAFEKLMLSFDGRPHWAKEFSIQKDTFETMYPKFKEFNRIRNQMDPNGMFLNNYLRRIFVNEEKSEEYKSK